MEPEYKKYIPEKNELIKGGVMGLLKKKLSKQVDSNKKSLPMVVLGLDNSGKTTIIKSFQKEEIKYITPT